MLKEVLYIPTSMTTALGKNPFNRSSSLSLSLPLSYMHCFSIGAFQDQRSRQDDVARNASRRCSIQSPSPNPSRCVLRRPCPLVGANRTLHRVNNKKLVTGGRREREKEKKKTWRVPPYGDHSPSPLRHIARMSTRGLFSPFPLPWARRLTGLAC